MPTESNSFHLIVSKKRCSTDISRLGWVCTQWSIRSLSFSVRNFHSFPLVSTKFVEKLIKRLRFANTGSTPPKLHNFI
jgi:hypothetical protein